MEVGAFCSIAEDVTVVLQGEHRTEWVTTYPFSALWQSAVCVEGHPATKGNVTIGNDVWIGYGATIMSGVAIGDGAVIGCRAVVTRDVPPFSVVVGNPGRVVKSRFDEAVIARLIRVAWWNWDDEKICRFLPLMLSDGIEEFLRVAEA